jgi:hypothetical protein
MNVTVLATKHITCGGKKSLGLKKESCSNQIEAPQLPWHKTRTFLNNNVAPTTRAAKLSRLTHGQPASVSSTAYRLRLTRQPGRCEAGTKWK